jgi:hypothetical protein
MNLNMWYGGGGSQQTRRRGLFHLPAILFPVAFAGQRLLGPELLARLQVKGVSFDFLNNVLLLDLSLEAAKGVFQRLALLKLYFSQTKYTSQLDLEFPCVALDLRDRTSELHGATPKFPALHTEGTDIIGG